jgi:hypothetical protein
MNPALRLRGGSYSSARHPHGPRLRLLLDLAGMAKGAKAKQVLAWWLRQRTVVSPRARLYERLARVLETPTVL